jgi:ankyrin repeat protein
MHTQALISAGADKDAKDRNGLTALQVSLLAGWQNIAGGIPGA